MNVLKMLREEQGLSQQNIADKIGTTQQSIHRYEHGLTEPDIKTLIQLADIFDVSVDFLIGHTDIRHKYDNNDKFEFNKTETSIIKKYRDFASGKKQFFLKIMAELDSLTIE